MDYFFSILINLIILGILVYTYIANRTFFFVALLIVVLLLFIFPNILIPSHLWENILKI